MKHTLLYVDSEWEFAIDAGNPKLVLSDNLEAWDSMGDGREGTYVYLWLIHVDV